MTQPHDMTLPFYRHIKKFNDGILASAEQQAWIERAKEYARINGTYKIPLDVGGVSCVVSPTHVEWHFVAAPVGDDYIVVVPEPGHGLWSLLHDANGSGELRTLHSEDMPGISGANLGQLEEVLSTFGGQVERYGQRYLGWPVPPKPAEPMSRDEKQKYIILFVVLGILAICGTCGFSVIMVLLFHNR